MEQQKVHWKKLINPKYLGAYSLPIGQDMIVVIRSVGREMVAGDGGKKEECMVAQIVGNKPFILNRTNCKTIERMYGPYIEDWAGKSITLYESTAKFGKETFACLRIRPIMPQVAQPILPPIANDRFENALSQIKANQYSVDQLHQKFTLNQEQLNRLSQELSQ